MRGTISAMGAESRAMKRPAGGPCTPAGEIVEALGETRERTLALVAPLSDGQLERTYSKLMSPLVWDLAHIAAFEDLWLSHRYGGLPQLRVDLAEIYDAIETPRARRGTIELLAAGQAREYMREVRARALEVIEQRGIGSGQLHELTIRHEQQHNETMLQAIQLARLDGYALPEAHDARDAGARAGANGTADAERARRPAGGETAGADTVELTGLEMVEIPACECTIGTDSAGFAYDNERPSHRVFVDAFQIGRAPVTNAAFFAFVRDGGYARREWWSAAGWAWMRETGSRAPGAWSEEFAGEWRLGGLEPLQPDRPVTSISWFEADAFARSQGARLPTELEWEKAATWDPELGRARAFPWGETPPAPGIHANVDHIFPGPEPATDHPSGASAYGVLGMVGDVWEWTASAFRGYPGFVADPYPEYSEVFFGDAYRVLRGGSWATRARVITPAFRNWDLPQRRQIFAGFRIARSA